MLNNASNVADPQSRSPNWLLKGMAVCSLYIFLGHPHAYVTVWERKAWLAIAMGPIVIPILLMWAIQVLVWRVRIDSATIEIRSLRGTLKKPLSEISSLERTEGRISVAFIDGSRRVIPSIIGNLDELLHQIASRRHLPPTSPEDR
jgi:hypothetical protein